MWVVFFFLRAQTRHQWVKSPLLGPSLVFYFPFLTFGDAGGCWYSLIVTSSVSPLRPWCVHQPVERCKGGWHHPKYQMIRLEKEQMTQRKHITCWLLSSRAKDQSWVCVRKKDPLHIILHLLPFVFYCQLDLQWEDYTMLVFCFIMLLFLIFQNLRTLYCFMSSQKNAYFLEVSEIPFRIAPLWPEIGFSPSFPMFWYTCQPPRHGNARLLQMDWNTGKCKNIY